MEVTMTNKFILFSICFLLLIIVGCRSNNIIQHRKESIMTSSYSTEDAPIPKISRLSLDKQNNPSDGSEMKISMMLTQETCSSSTEKMNVIIKNNTLVQYYTGMKYSIEYFNSSTWVKVPLDIVVNYSIVLLKSKESEEFSVYLYPEQYHYKAGKYRICKTVYLTTDAKDAYELTSEFNIK